MSRLANPNARFADDHGEADPITREAMAKVHDHTSYVRALVALCSSRLLMPIVASGDETDHPDPSRQAEMAAVKLLNEYGEFLLAFTGIGATGQAHLISPPARLVAGLDRPSHRHRTGTRQREYRHCDHLPDNTHRHHSLISLVSPGRPTLARTRGDEVKPTVTHT